MIHIYLSYTRKKESHAAHELLQQVLVADYGISAPQLSYGVQGKPYLPQGPDFSISHSRGYVAVAVSDREVGLDMEMVRPYPERLPRRIFSQEELRWFQSRWETQVDFFTLWTLKESYFKFLGTGLLGFPNGTCFYQDEENNWHLENSPLFFQVLEEKNLLLTVCCQKETEIMCHWI